MRESAKLEQFDIGLKRGDAWSGVNGAWTILNRDLAGFEAKDAGQRSIKALGLSGSASANERAESYLDRMPARAVDAGLQMVVNDTIALMAEKGMPHPEPLTVDGAFGPGSASAFEAILHAFGVDQPTANDRISRARALSQAYWIARGVRIDTL